MSAAVWMVRNMEEVHSLDGTDAPFGSDASLALQIVSPGVAAR